MQIRVLRTATTMFVRRVTGPLVFGKRLPGEFGGAKLYVTSRADMRLLYPGYGRSAHDLLTVAAQFIKPGAVVWDIGSNLGIFAFAAAAKAGPRGQVFTVEADPRYAELQNRSAARLPAHYGRVRTLCAAVADRVGILELSIPANGHARNHLSVVAGNNAAPAESTKTVVSLTLDSLLEHWPAPQFLKMDVEGAELLALRGATRLLSSARPAMYIEVCSATRDAVTAILRQSGYRFYKLRNSDIAPLDSCEFETIAIPTN